MLSIDVYVRAVSRYALVTVWTFLSRRYHVRRTAATSATHTSARYTVQCGGVAKMHCVWSRAICKKFAIEFTRLTSIDSHRVWPGQMAPGARDRAFHVNGKSATSPTFHKKSHKKLIKFYFRPHRERNNPKNRVG